MAHPKTGAYSHGVTQAEEIAVADTLGKFIRAWCEFRGDPSHENYHKAKEAHRECGLLLEEQKRQWPAEQPGR